PAQEFPLEQTIELAPPPPVEVTPPPPLEFAPEPPAIVEPQPAPTFPELRVADDRGLHQIQIVISPIHSFSRLLETEARIRALSPASPSRDRLSRGSASPRLCGWYATSPVRWTPAVTLPRRLWVGPLAHIRKGSEGRDPCPCSRRSSRGPRGYPHAPRERTRDHDRWRSRRRVDSTRPGANAAA